MSQLRKSAVTEINRQVSEMLDYELLSTWRLGYDYAYVWHEHTTAGADELEFDVSLCVYKTDDPDWHPSDEAGPVQRFDVHELTRETVRAVN